jgi:serine/threonine-protein kinase
MAADQDLLFGLLALQNGLINQGQLLAAFQAWTLERSKSVADHLEARGDLTSSRRAVLEALAAVHLDAHGGDVEKSLAAVSPGESIRESLARLGALEISATLLRVGSADGSTEYGDPDRTTSFGVGSATSDGQRFQILRPHARGGLGEVFVARDTELNREVALKQILDHHAGDQGRRARFMLEAEITGGLEHPGVVPVYGLGMYPDGRPYYAMRFIRGESFKQAIDRFHADSPLPMGEGGRRPGEGSSHDPAMGERGRRPGEGSSHDPGRRSLALRNLLRRFLDVCNVIDYAHSRGVLHRDIKPANVIVGKFGETLVVDWGLAKAVGRSDPPTVSEERTLVPSLSSGSAETLPGSALGTPAYMSPEQAAGDLERLGPRSDVYSLGATLYCLLSGVPPYQGKPGEVLRAAQDGVFLPPRQRDPGIDPSLEAVCLKAMAPEPENRYPGARALAEDVERWIADEPVSARREPVFARLARSARRHRTSVAALGLAMITAVVLLAISNVLVTNAQRATARALARVKQEQGRTALALRRADANFRHARQAVDDYFTTVSEDLLLDEPGMQPLRNKLLRSALTYHEMFLKERAGDPGVELEVAESHRRYAELCIYTGRVDDPLPHLQIARERFEHLARQHPESPVYRRGLARTLSDTGIALTRKKSQREEALHDHRAAIAIYEELLRSQPDDSTILEDLASTVAELGERVSEQLGGSEEAARLIERARRILEHLIAEQPDSLRHRLKLAALYDKLYGSLIGNQRRQDEALHSSDEALRIYNELLQRAPRSPRFQVKVGTIHDTRGILYTRRNKLPEAILEAQQARKILADVVRTNPENETYRVFLANAAMRLGLDFVNAGASPEALGPLREACDAYEHILKVRPGEIALQSYAITSQGKLGEALANLGRYDESAVAYKRAVELAANVSRQDPSNVFVRGALAGVKFAHAVSLTRSGRHHEDAIAAYEEFRSIRRELFGGENISHGDPGVVEAALVSMGYSLRELGRVKEAERAVNEAIRSLGNDANPFYELARYDARGAQRLAAAGGDPRAVDALARKALAALQKAVTLGFSDRSGVQEVGDRFQLRDRPEFQIVLLDLVFPRDVFARGD